MEQTGRRGPLYHEALTWNKLVGVAVCLVGLVLLNT